MAETFGTDHPISGGLHVWMCAEQPATNVCANVFAAIVVAPSRNDRPAANYGDLID